MTDQSPSGANDSFGSTSASSSSSFNSLKSFTSNSKSKCTSSRSKSNLSEFVSLHIAKAMLWSDMGLSMFSYPLDRERADVVCTQLSDLNLRIIAVWVVARPLSYKSRSRFHHWCIKIQADGALISLDFLECKKKGYIKLDQTVASNAELKDFLHYYYIDKNIGRQRKKWKIIASVTPSPLINTSYWGTQDDHDEKKLKLYTMDEIKHNKNNQKKRAKKQKLVKSINCRKKVCDIADFIEMWTQANHDQNKLNGHKQRARDKPYNAIINNCQQFSADLFHYLVGNQYKKKAQKVYDMREVQVNKKKRRNARKAKQHTANNPTDEQDDSKIQDDDDQH